MRLCLGWYFVFCFVCGVLILVLVASVVCFNYGWWWVEFWLLDVGCCSFVILRVVVFTCHALQEVSFWFARVCFETDLGFILGISVMCCMLITYKLDWSLIV